MEGQIKPSVWSWHLALREVDIHFLEAKTDRLPSEGRKGEKEEGRKGRRRKGGRERE